MTKNAPFELPVHVVDKCLVAADHELICRCEAATEEELEYIASRINSMPRNEKEA